MKYAATKCQSIDLPTLQHILSKQQLHPSQNHNSPHQGPLPFLNRETSAAYLHTAATSKSTLTGSVLPISSTTEGGLSLTTKLILLALPSLRTSGSLLMSGGHNLGRQPQVSAEVLNPLGSKVAVRMLPAVSETDVSTRLEGFHEREDLEVGGPLDVGVGGGDGVFFDDDDSLAEEVGEDGYAVGLGDEHDVDLGWSLFV